MTYDFLNRLRVVESSAFVAAPMAGLTLAQYGADVIHIDRIGGGIDYGRVPRLPSGRSLYWTALNKGKRSIAVDISSDAGRELVRSLVTAPGPDAGVLLTNIATPWLSHEVLSALRADVVTCTIIGNPDGSTALDYTVNCATGYPYVTGNGSPATPVNHVLPAWDLSCAYQAAFAVLAAVSHRRQTGLGAELRLALSDIAFATLSNLGVLGEATVLNQERPAIGNHIYGAFGHDFATAGGERIMVAAISVAQWKALVKACGIGDAIKALESATGKDFLDEVQRYEARDAIAALVEPWFAVRPLAQAKAELDQHRVCWGQYRTVKELLDHDARVSLANPLFETIDTPGIGRHIAAGAMAQAVGVARQPTSPAPLVGTHTDEILAEVLGLSGAAIGRLHDAGVVAGPEADPTVQPNA